MFIWKRKALLACTAIGAIGILFAACTNNGANAPTVGCQGGPLKVVVTLPLFADFACQVGGERVTVTTLIPVKADPHTYQPAPEDADQIREASLILYNGLDLDKPAVDFIFQRAHGTAQLIGYALSVSSPTADQPPQDQPPITAQAAGDNPHLWLDIELAKVYVASTEDSLEIVDPDGIPFYRQNADAYTALLDELQNEIQQSVQSIPPERRKLVTYHDSFPHFARRYGLELLGPITTNTQQSPSPEEVDALAQEITAAGLPSLFAEKGFERSAAEALAEKAGVRVCTLYSDILDKEADTYIKMMRSNAEELLRCLGE